MPGLWSCLAAPSSSVQVLSSSGMRVGDTVTMTRCQGHLLDARHQPPAPKQLSIPKEAAEGEMIVSFIEAGFL